MGVYNYPPKPVVQVREAQTHRILEFVVGYSGLDSFLNCCNNKILIGSLLPDVGVPSLKIKEGGRGAPNQLYTPLWS